MTNFSERLRSLRTRRNWTQADIAGKLGVTGHYVSMLESGAHPSETLKKLFAQLENLSDERLMDSPARSSVIREQNHNYVKPDRSDHDRFRGQLHAALDRIQGWLEELPRATNDSEREKILQAAHRAINDLDEWQRRQPGEK
jgi:transcriptional regulator with XRE-family HTH domain